MDDFFDGFDEGGFMDGDDFEDKFDENFDPEGCSEDEPEVSGEPDEAESQEDAFSAREAFFFGSAMGWAYEEGLEEAERRKLEKEMEEVMKGRKRDSET